MFGEADLEAMQRLRTAFDPARAREPRQALPDAAPLRRGARAVPRPPARGGGPCRAVLSARASSSTSRATSPASSRRASRSPRSRPRSPLHGQRLSLDPPGDPTLGECLLEDLSGPLRHRFGTMRDLVIGVTVAPPRRDAGELRRQGREERRRLRPRQALLRLARAARRGRAARAAAAPAAGRAAHGRRRRVAEWPRLHRSAARAERRRPRRRPDARALRGSERAPSRAQAEELGGERGRAAGRRCGRCSRGLPGRVRWDGGAAPLVRPGPRVAYVEEEPDEHVEPARRARRGGVVQPELIADCVHCGFCLPTCPTYELWHEEMDSPRGRIHLMAGLVDGSLALDRHGRRAFRPLPRLHGVRDRVPVRRAVRPADRDDARAHRAAPPPRGRRAAAAAADLRGVPAPPPAARRAGAAAAAGARAVRAAARRSRRRGSRAPWPPGAPAGDRARAWRSSPAACRASSSATSTRRPRASSRPTGYDVHVPRAQGCCGALHAHAGRLDEGVARAHKLADDLRGYDAIVTNAAGCGSHLKDHGIANVVDVSELLADPPARAERHPLALARRVPGLVPSQPRAAHRARAARGAGARSRASSLLEPARAGALLRQRRHLQPRPARGGPRARRPQGDERPRDRARRVRERQPGLPRPGDRGAPARRPAARRRSIRSSSSTRRSAASTRLTCCATLVASAATPRAPRRRRRPARTRPRRATARSRPAGARSRRRRCTTHARLRRPGTPSRPGRDRSSRAR